MVNYARYKELTSKFKVPQEEVDKLIKDVKKGMWTKNRRKFIKETAPSK